MGDDIGSGGSFKSVCFDFFLNLRRQLSNRNMYFWRFSMSLLINDVTEEASTLNSPINENARLRVITTPYEKNYLYTATWNFMLTLYKIVQKTEAILSIYGRNGIAPW